MFASWDASIEWGMGGFLDGEFFAVKWTELLSSPGTKPFYPKPGTESWHINYMELFAGYWFIRKWGPKLTGMKLICWTDNSATEGMLKNMFGKATFIPLLKEILLLLRKYDMEMEPKHISSKDNISLTASQGVTEWGSKRQSRTGRMFPLWTKIWRTGNYCMKYSRTCKQTLGPLM